MALFVKEVLLMGHMTPVELEKMCSGNTGKGRHPNTLHPRTWLLLYARQHCIWLNAWGVLNFLCWWNWRGKRCLNVCLFNMSGVIPNAHLDRKKTRQVVKGDLISETEYKGEIELRVGRDRGGWRVRGVSRKLWKNKNRTTREKHEFWKECGV